MGSGKQFLVATLAALVVAGGAKSAVAAAEYKIDPAQSTVIFKVKNRDISHVYGRFNSVSGLIKVNELRNPSEFDFTVEIRSKSLDTNDKKRDKKLKGPDFFNASAYPKITFVGKTGKKLKDKKFELTGKLDILGAKKDLTVIFQLTGVKRIKRGEYRLGGESTFTVKRSDLGMSFMLPEIADEVTIMVNIEAFVKLRPAG